MDHQKTRLCIEQERRLPRNQWQLQKREHWTTKKKVVLEQLTKVLQHIMDTEKSPAEWKDSSTIPIFKGKGDPLQCGKYRGLRLLEHSMKVWEKILDRRLKTFANVSSNQFGFLLKDQRLMQYSSFGKCSTSMSRRRRSSTVFVNLEKAFDRIPRRTLRWALRKQRVPEKLVRLVLALYDDSKSCVAAAGGISAAFSVSVGVHQGSGLSPLLFNLVMQESTRKCHRGVA